MFLFFKNYAEMASENWYIAFCQCNGTEMLSREDVKSMVGCLRVRIATPAFGGVVEDADVNLVLRV